MRFLDKYSARDKRLLALEREMNRLNQAHRDAPIIPLERPYQRGRAKFFVLDEEILRRADTAIFRTMLPQINQYVIARDRSFLTKRGQPILLRPRVIPTREWIKLGWPAKQQRFFSYGHWRLDHEPWRSIKWREQARGFKLINLSWIREEVQPHLITHQRVDLPDVRSRLTEIKNHFEFTRGWERLHRLHGRSQWWRRMTFSACELRSDQSCSEQLRRTTTD
jgi:hypothetical protein